MKASTFQLVFMTYAVVCSGAYGLEEMVSKSGPGIALLTLFLLPVVWGAPVALACAELSARHPVEGGYYRWAAMAFGDFAGFMTGWLVYLSVFATNAAFAVLFVNYLRHFVPVEGVPRFLAAVALVWLTTFLNYRGIVLVGTAAVVMTVLIFLPFLGLTIAGLFQWRFDPLVPFVHPDKTPLAAFLGSSGIAIWLFSGWEKLRSTRPRSRTRERPSRSPSPGRCPWWRPATSCPPWWDSPPAATGATGARRTSLRWRLPWAAPGSAPP